MKRYDAYKFYRQWWLDTNVVFKNVKEVRPSKHHPEDLLDTLGAPQNVHSRASFAKGVVSDIWDMAEDPVLIV